MTRLAYHISLIILCMTCLFLPPSANAQQVSLSWQDPNNDPAEVGGYYLYYWQSDWEMPESVAVGDQTSYSLSDLTLGQTYSFAVTTHDGQGGRESVYSNIVTHTLATSPPVTQQIPLNWQDPNNNTAEVGGYYLYYWQSDWEMPESVTVGNQTSYVLSGLYSGQTYSFAVTTHDGQGGRESAYSNIVTYTLAMSPPVASFSATPTTGMMPLMVAFNDTSTGSIDAWLWTFGDGGSSTNANPSYTYNAAGTYTVSLQVTGPDGSHTTTQSNLITVAETAPVANFSTSTTAGTAPLQVAFQNTSTGSTNAWLWTFGDGGSSTSANPSHTYNAAGTYTVSLQVTGPGGADTTTQSNLITVTAMAPVANFNASTTSGPAPLQVAFQNTSTGSINAWLWTFGDGGSSPSANPSHTYNAAGTYTVSLQVTGPGGSDTTTQNSLITVAEPELVANFSASATSGPAPLQVTFNDQSSGQIDTRLWNFGDGNTSSEQHPTHTYTVPGTYTVSLQISGPSGSDTATKTDYITLTTLEDLVAAYSFNEGSGTGVIDASGNANEGTLSGATWTSQGKFGNALTFDGVNDWVTIPNAPTLDLTASMTLEAWVYPTATLTKWSSVLLKEQPGHLVYALYAGAPDNLPSVYFNVSTSGNGERSVKGPAALPLNTWSYLAGTYDGTTLRFYVNGALVASQAATGTITTSSGALRIGGNSIWSDEYFQGYIDEVRIYNRALTEDEIRDDMDTPIESQQPDTDGDGLSDADEAAYGTDPNVADTDGDGINDGDEVALWEANWEHNYDGDTIANNLLDPDADNDGYSDGLELHYLFDPSDAASMPSLSFLLETGELSVDHNWQRVDFKTPFFDPIVIANPPSSNDVDPVTVRVRNVNATGFEIRLQEWNYLTVVDGGSHQPETLSYVAMERGSFTLADGTLVEANQFSTDRMNFVTVPFNQTFRVTPVVVTTMSSFNEADAVTGRLKAISSTSFRFRLQEEEGNAQTHALEAVSYIAWEPSSGTIDGVAFDIGTTGDVVRHPFHQITFAAAFTDAPRFLAEMQTADGRDTATVRCQNKDALGVEVNIAEEQSKDSEIKHTTEVVGYFAIR